MAQTSQRQARGPTVRETPILKPRAAPNLPDRDTPKSTADGRNAGSIPVPCHSDLLRLAAPVWDPAADSGFLTGVSLGEVLEGRFLTEVEAVLITAVVPAVPIELNKPKAQTVLEREPRTQIWA